ncbi:cobalt-precorrin 5A hydrolase [Butyrivibrio sp. NC2002]|uniref:cobalt-precorrin 5A hydrolase n=1 Tax=Butyrivibrio sp. NC2002 TaxID=1410610 RepID=UPI0005643A75|nr:cobalt-precorrin 5A hydrolase [Butyrivibrio sp. NC2002]
MEITEALNYKFICFTDNGRRLMIRLRKLLIQEVFSDGKKVIDSPTCQDESEGEHTDKYTESSSDLGEWVKKCFVKGNILVFIGAAGIAVRAISGHLRDKTQDPAVIVIDEAGKYVIPILSGHIGGGVEAARLIASLLGAEAVITTASDIEGKFAIDVFATKNNLIISDMKKAKEYTASLLKDEDIRPKCRIDERFKDFIHLNGFLNTGDMDHDNTYQKTNEFLISPAISDENIPVLIPKCIVIGLGCKKGISFEKICAFCKEKMSEAGLDLRSIKAIASIDLKRSEPCLNQLSEHLGVPFKTFSAEELMAQEGDFTKSPFVEKTTGTDNVCERAVMACGCKKILVKKTAEEGMTFAAGIMELEING